MNLFALLRRLFGRKTAPGTLPAVTMPVLYATGLWELDEDLIPEITVGAFVEQLNWDGEAVPPVYTQSTLKHYFQSP